MVSDHFEDTLAVRLACQLQIKVGRLQLEQVGQELGVVHIRAVARVAIGAWARVYADALSLLGGKALQHQVVQVDETVEKAPGSEAHTLEGKYQNRKDHSVVQFKVADNTLQVFGMSLKRVGHNQFVTPMGPTVSFEIMNGKMKVTAKDGDRTMFEGIRIDELHLGEPALKAYAGEYKSTELDATYKLIVDNGSLTLRAGWNREVKLEPLVADEFAIGQLGTAVFRRDATDHVSGLSVYSGRIRGVGFERTH